MIVALPGLFSYFFYSTDRSKAVIPVLVILFVALWFILRGDLLYVFPCVILFLCFSVLLVLRLPRLGKRELILVLFVHLFDLRLFGFVGFLFLLRFVIVALPGLFSYLFFQTDAIFFYQGTVSAIKFRKRLTKFKITITLPKKFVNKGFITVVKVTKICRSSGESNKLRYVYPICVHWGTSPSRKGN